ncbi:acetyl-CoA synthetase-like protein [Teratosphaeria nubilosa]|uniref:Acetyl-CoA synthetase-like protein n=1 Tax=Teratosphaeria nubilosa TaxID=161662 RepID=A0A6G1KVI0_9PEZI|nr:acetyl-CoA synthetase-like protein [Teratosphaeria nubilosa]
MPEYGRRLIPQILDSIAAANPHRVLYSVAAFSDDCYDFHHITAKDLAQAVDKTAWWLRSSLGDASNIRPLAYIGPHDLCHILLTYASVKAGCTALFLSPKNAVEGALAVLSAADCHIWVQPSQQQPTSLIEQCLEKRPMRVLEMPTLAELFDAESTEPFPYEKSFQDVARQPFCILHTSGTTGVPKPVPWSHGLVGTMDAVRLLPPVEGDGGLQPWTSLWHEGDTLYSSFPMSHGAGIIMDIIMPSLYGLRCVLGPSDVLPSLNLVEKLATHARIDIWSMVPCLVDELVDSPDTLARLEPSKFICASGGPVSPDVACKINDVIRILNLTGTTEGLFIGNLVVNRQDWQWFSFHPYSGFEFKEVETGVFEHWVHRNEHWPFFQGIFHTFPDKQSINLKDLYVKHPTKQNHWAFKGRSDDVVVLSNGYKISPLQVESYVSTHPAINGALVIGTGKRQAGLLIELKEPTQRGIELLDSIWNTIEKANEISAKQDRLLRNYIAFAESSKPFVRTDKGTVKRHATLLLYADFIERFYDSRDRATETMDMDTTSRESIENSVRQVLARSVPAILEASVDTDLFSLGLDSLLVIEAVSIIKNCMGIDKLEPSHIYANPTLAKFSRELFQLVLALKQSSDTNLLEPGTNQRESHLKRLIDQQKARWSQKLNPFDCAQPNQYAGLVMYLPLREGTDPAQVFAWLQLGLQRAMNVFPALGGQIMPAAASEIGYKEGDLRVVIPPQAATNDTVRQLKFKDLSRTLPPFSVLRSKSFSPSTVCEDMIQPCDTFPAYPTDIVAAQANFVDGGCILVTNIHHCCFDGCGVIVALKVWAESCRFIAGDPSANCSWLDPECFNHSLPGIVHELEGNKKQVHEVDPGTWAFVGFLPPEPEVDGHLGATPAQNDPSYHPNPLPSPPVWDKKTTWPPLPDPAGRALTTTTFLITSEKLRNLQQAISASLNKGICLSLSDIVQAFFWRHAIRARYRVARIQGHTFTSEEQSVLELPINIRPYFSTLIPSTYTGNMLTLNRAAMAVEKLCSPETSVAEVACLLRETAARITVQVVHDTFTLLESLPSYDPQGRFSYADMGLDGMHAMISNMMLFQPREISFGDAFFANGGSPEVLQPLIERGKDCFRFLAILPTRSDGGIELMLGTLPEELDMLVNDDEFTQYATLLAAGQT